MTTTNEGSESNQPLGLALTDQLGPAPWADDVEAWLEASNSEEIADDIYRYALAEVVKAVAAERERCAKLCEQRTTYWQRDDIRKYEDECCAAAIRGPNAKVSGAPATK